VDAERVHIQRDLHVGGLGSHNRVRPQRPQFRWYHVECRQLERSGRVLGSFTRLLAVVDPPIWLAL
jgi:hypothetical protein